MSVPDSITKGNIIVVEDSTHYSFKSSRELDSVPYIISPLPNGLPVTVIPVQNTVLNVIEKEFKSDGILRNWLGGEFTKYFLNTGYKDLDKSVLDANEDDLYDYKSYHILDLKLEKALVDKIEKGSVISFQKKETEVTTNKKSLSSLIKDTLDKQASDGKYYLLKDIRDSYRSYLFKLPKDLNVSCFIEGQIKFGKITDDKIYGSPDEVFVQWVGESSIQREHVINLRLNAEEVSYDIDPLNSYIIFKNRPTSAGGMKMTRERHKKSLSRKKKVKHISSKSGYKRK